MVTRADKYTINTNRSVYFADFLTDFSLNPVTGELARVTNEESVKQSLKNLIMTMKGERFYDDNKGSNVFASMFDLMSPMVVEDVRSSIYEVVSNYMPVVELININVEFNDNNELRVIIEFSIINIPNKIFTLNFIVERIR